MNCKQGDIAIIIKSRACNEGKVVKCIKFIGKMNGWERDDRWEIDIPLVGFIGGVTNSIPDAYLRPIRDSDKQDEMLSIVNLKEKVKS